MSNSLAAPNTKIHPDDEMFQVALQTLKQEDLARSGYFRQGAEIHETIVQIANWRFGKLADVSKYLEFACGYGRSTRFLVRELDPSKVWVSDIYTEAVAFQEDNFHVNGFASVTDPDKLVCETNFDLIFVASLFTHLPEARFEAWLKRLYSMLSSRGVLAFSVHDEVLAAGRTIPKSGMLFLAESESQSLGKVEYGTNIVTEGYVRSAIAKAAGPNWKYHREPKALCGAHDVYLVSGSVDEDFSGFRYHKPLVGYCDEILEISGATIQISDWAGEPNDGFDVDEIQIFLDGTLVGVGKAELPRSDVVKALGQPKYANSGWRIEFSRSMACQEPAMIEVRVRSQSGATTMIHIGPLNSSKKAPE